MPTINQLPTIDTLQPDDLLPVYSTSNGDARKASVNTLAQLVAEQVDQFIANPSNATPQPATTLGAPGIDVDYSRADHSHPKTGVDSVSVASANGLAGTVAGPATTPQITLSTTVSGVLKGNGTAISAAVAGTDYSVPITTRDEGVNLTTATSSIDFTGTGVTATSVGGAVTVNIPGGGSVTSVSVASANGFAGTVANPTTTPAITMTTSVSGILKGNGTAISAATSGTDYSAGTSALATGILKTTTGTGALSVAVAADFPTLNQNTTGTAANVTGTVAVVNGGTGLTATPTNGQIDIGNGAGFTRTTLTAGSNISITNGAGSITIAATGGGSFDPALTQSYGGASGDESVKILASGATGTNFFQFQGGTGISPAMYSVGASANISWDMRSKGTGDFDFRQDAGGAQYQFRIRGVTGAAVNYMEVAGAATGGVPSFTATGGDTNVNALFRTKGTGELRLRPNGADGFAVTSTASLTHTAGGTKITAAGNTVLRSYATGSLPSASTEGAGATVRDSTTGELKMSNGSSWVSVGGSASALTLISLTTASNSATVDVTGLDNTYKSYVIEWDNLSLDSVATLNVQVNAGGSLQTSGYTYAGSRELSDGTSSARSSTSATSVEISSQLSAGTFQIGRLEIGRVTGVDAFGMFRTACLDASVRAQYQSGAFRQGQSNTTAVRFLPSTGLIASGTFRLYGLRASV